jgi:hypothetical protein
MASTVSKLIVAAAGALAGSAVAKELSKPVDQRTWHGEVAGVPYDFRPPTVEKIKRTVWDPESPTLFPPHAFGVGWSVNVARLVALAQPEPARQPAEAPPGIAPAPAGE